MDCQEIINVCSDYVDGRQPPEEKQAIETHLKGCSACRQVYEDMRSIAGAARSLPHLMPSEGLWMSLEKRLKEEAARNPGRPIPMPKRRTPGAGRWVYPRLAFAAAALLFLVISVWLLMWKVGLKEKDHAEIARTEIRQAEMHYRKAIDSLNQVIAARKSTWDPQFADIFETNLKKIDQAISECREAVRKSPNDLEAETFLLAAYGRKVEFLQEILQSGS